MNRLRAITRISLRTKVLVPLIAVMALLMAATASVVNRRITLQTEAEARRALTAAKEGFRNWRNNRTENLLLRFEDLRNEPRYRAAFQTGDPPTVRAQLNDLLATANPDVRILFFTTPNQELIATAKRDPLLPAADFESAISSAVKRALHGDEDVDTVQTGDKLYDVVSLPVFGPAGENLGALTLGLELSDAAAAELSRFTHSQIVFLANGQVVVNTLVTSDPSARFAAIFRKLVNSANPRAELNITAETFEGRHFYCSGGRFGSMNGNSTLGYLLVYSYEESWSSLATTQQILLATDGLGILLGIVVVCFLVGKVTAPLRILQRSVEAVGRGDFSRRVEVNSNDECGELASVFNQMTENLQRSRHQLEGAQAELLEASRRTGMAEVATGVLHNVGNVLTSVNVASSLMEESLKKSRAANLAKLVALLRSHQADLGGFLTNDPKGQQVIDYLGHLSEHLINEQEGALHELSRLQKGIEHIRDIVKAQQSYSKVSGAPEEIAVADLVEDALRMNSGSRGNIQLKKDLEADLRVKVEKHKVLQILVNLIRNARQACEASDAEVKTLNVRASREGNSVHIAITDNGVGIARENLQRIFSHGFTTKKDGHGFGLNSSALTAKELGGALCAQSDGVGKGATFTLELPAILSGNGTAARN